jgi:glycosyltransferase involved in cell wall biosynthesis/Tfp pilus assembly protein PilF
MPIHVRSKRRAPAPEPAATRAVAVPALPAPPSGWQQKPPGVSLCMIVKNEERFLPQCLRSVKEYVDEIVVVDTGSTDRTIEIAESFGAVVVQRPWRDDFAWARNESLTLATKRWILFMDADEELTTDSRAALLAVKTLPAYDTALWVRIYNKTDDYLGSGDVSHALIRIFPNDERIRFRGLIHEYPAIDGNEHSIEAVHSEISFVHHGYVKDVVSERRKGERNLSILREATQREPENPYHWYNLGTTAYLTNDYELARSSLERMRELVGDGSRAFMPNGLALLADIYCEHFSDPTRAEALANQSLRRSPHYANAHMMLGKTLVVQKRFDEARAAFTAAIEDRAYAKNQFIVDDQVYVWKAQSEMGSSYAAQGDDAGALEWFERGLANAPTVEPLMINRAKALERLGRSSESYDAYRRAYETHQSAHAMLYFVNFLLRSARATEALAIVEEWYPRLEPKQAAELLTGAAGVSERYGYGKELQYLRLARQLDPQSVQVGEALRRVLSLELRRTLEERRAERALVAADELLGLDPSAYEALMSRAAACELLASPAGVEASLLRAREVDAIRGSVALSMFYLREQRYGDAAAIADGALDTRETRP